jgi:SsrA-binding protein
MNSLRAHTAERKPLTIRLIAENRAARYEYSISDEIEAGIELVGTEVKSLRKGGVQLAGSYARFHNDELWLENAHISIMKEANINNHDPLRTRKLLLHQTELRKLSRRTQAKGVTIVPTKMYFKGNKVKVMLGIAVGKKQHDKRETIKERDRKRESQRTDD